MTFTSDSCAAMKHIEDIGPKSRAEEMEVVDKVNEEVREEEMDHGDRSTEENAFMDTEELREGQQVGEDNEDELEEGEIADSDAEPGEVAEVEEEKEMGHGAQPSEETVSMDTEELEVEQQVGEDDENMIYILYIITL